MKTYLVGGAVRDQLLGLEPKERDWVVVGSTPDVLAHEGYRPVGKDFPVFLHPKTHEEYALARTERKTSPGYTGFQFNASPNVTLEEDLMRRDLTINAIAQDESGKLVDPYDGQKDLDSRILRHVSDAFIEDPVRILRIARFAARFAYLGFAVAEETNELMEQMVNSGEIDSLVAERVWREFEKALCENNPEVFLQVLNDCGALSKLFPEVHNLSKACEVLAAAVDLSDASTVRFAAMMGSNDLLTEQELRAFCRHYKVPRAHLDLACLVQRFGKKFMSLGELNPEEVLGVLLGADALRREQRFGQMLLASWAIAGGQNYADGSEIIALFSLSLEKIKSVDVKVLVAKGLKGPELAKALKSARLEMLQNI